MIKSIFIKYILTFLVIITTSFAILAGLISAHIIRYSNETQQISMENASAAARQYIESTHSDIAELYTYAELLADELAIYLPFAENAFIFITDIDGQIILTTFLPEGYLLREYVSPNMMHEILEYFWYYRFNTLDGLFAVGHQIFPQPLINQSGEVFGVLFFCSSSAAASLFANQIINTIILSCLWVLTATMVILYFMTEKVVSPVRAMSKAARHFSLGKFDIRVPVKGGDEIAELAVAFNNMAAELAANDERQRMFISGVSHDLRTPMTTIIGFVEGILDGTIASEDRERYLNIVASESHRLARLVNTMFEITKWQSGERKLHKSAFDICEKARLVLLSLEQKITEKNIDIEFFCEADNIYVYADADEIHRVLQNLCENAVKFTPEGGFIRISILECEKDREKKAHVSVFNTGNGILPEDIPAIFDRFYKSDKSRGLDPSGSGLGLFITKFLIDTHEEALTVSSEYGKHCEFAFTLPITSKPIR